MPGKNQHVVPHKDGFAVRGAGNSKVTKVTDTQKEAISVAREIAKNQQSELFIHRPNGQIRQRDSYGNDPHPPKG
ncbi:DUF2188 domain-containing protein [Flavobacterium sp. RNTU_13]|uniref:DUF2188 domain-containing protein n=1 Tax=Flavobacterium sp. RNTU_13 TaxID=3375145 RepID=UPI003987CB81